MTHFTALVALLGLSAGVASLFLAQSLVRGFQEEIREKILANTAHISVFRNDGLPLKDYAKLIAEINDVDGIKAVSPTTYESAIIMGGKINSYAVLRVAEFEPKTADRIEVKLGRELAEKTGLEIGDKTELIVTDNNSAKNSTVYISEIFQTGLYEYDSTWIYLSPEGFTALFNRQKFLPTALSLTVTDIYIADDVAEKIRHKLGVDFKVIDWQEANQPLFAALSLEKKVSFAIISLIILIAVLNITTSLALLVNEKRHDIAILRTCGASTRSLLLIFILRGMFLGLSSTVLGVAVGLILSATGNYFRLIKLDSAIYLLDVIPFRISISELFSVVLMSLLLSFLATIYPAWRAAKIKPLENLRIN